MGAPEEQHSNQAPPRTDEAPSCSSEVAFEEGRSREGRRYPGLLEAYLAMP